jgi:hypothetical protein
MKSVSSPTTITQIVVIWSLTTLIVDRGYWLLRILYLVYRGRMGRVQLRVCPIHASQVLFVNKALSLDVYFW